MYAPATRLTRVELDAARTVFTGSARVSGILVCNATAGAVEVVFTDSDATEILSIAAPANTSFLYNVVWIASNGLLVASEGDANVSVTVAHGASGA